MSQPWALIAKNGAIRIIYTTGPDVHPEKAGHRDDCRGCEVVALDREPDFAMGETIKAGAIAFDPALAAEAVFPRIKASAAARIERIAPLWRQINDLRNPADPGAAARSARIDAVRAWSNRMEAKLLACTSAAEARELLAEIENLKIEVE